MLGLPLCLQKEPYSQLVMGIQFVSHFTFGEGRGLQVVSDMYYDFMSSFPLAFCPLSSVDFTTSKLFQVSFVLVGVFLCSFLCHIRNFRNKNKKVSGLVCCEVSTSLLLCWITDGHLAGFLLIYLSSSPIGPMGFYFGEFTNFKLWVSRHKQLGCFGLYQLLPKVLFYKFHGVSLMSDP